ncbi:MAG: trypsin-like serine protease [Pseudomonadota bacterium]
MSPHLPLRSVLCCLALLSAPAGADPVPRIIGGNDAGNGEYPFMAALVDPAVTSSDLDAQFCGGTIIAARWILTAGHCVTRDNGAVTAVDDIAVIAGATTLDHLAATATRIPVDGIIRHPDYNDSTLANDLALLHLAQDAATDALFAPDDDSTTGSLVNGDDVTAIGWGLIDENPATITPVLQEAVLDYIAYNTCNNLYGNQLPGKNVCAGYLTDPPRDSCRGDSGGPLLRAIGGGAWRQIGITSFGDESGCAQADFPGVYTRVGQFSAFIVGAQSQPDLRTTVTKLTLTGGHAVARVTIDNLSQFNAAANTTVAITRDGNPFTIVGTGSTFACAATPAGDQDCVLGTLAPGASAIIDVELEFPGPGTFRIVGTASTTSGDYYASNNSASRVYVLARAARKKDDGGVLAGSLGMLALLLLRRRRSPRGA